MIIIDVEIEKAILGRNETPIEGIEYCQGWRDFENMGIACVCTYDIATHRSRVFFKGDLPALGDYLQDKPTAGFNTKRFDLPLLKTHGVDVEWAGGGGPHYDILEEIWIALGLNPDKFNPQTHGGWGLDAVCQATLGIAKTGNGALAPVWWQQGHVSCVADYCLNDVWMEGQLLLHVLQGGYVTNGKGEELTLSRPVEWLSKENVIGRQYGAAQAKAFAEVPDTAGTDAVASGGLGIIR